MIEVCGVLIGNGYRDEHGPYLLVEHVIRGNGAKNRSANVTFTAETWASIQTVMDNSYPDKKMIGWYHTHPGFGIFLSDMDIFICENFFNLPWQIAFVYDPVSGEEGNFIWKEGRPKREYVLIEDDVTPEAAAIPLIPRNEIPSSDVVPDEPIAPRTISVQNGDPRLIELMIRVRRLERRQKTIVIAMAFIAAFVIMWAVMFQQPINSTINKAVSQPTTVSPKVTTDNPQPAAINPKPATDNPQPTAINPKATTVNPQPTTINPKPTTVNPQPATINPKATTDNPKPTPHNPQPTNKNAH